MTTVQPEEAYRFAEAPSAEVAHNDSKFLVRFNLGKLLAIEAALNKTVNQILMEDFGQLSANPADPDAFKNAFRMVGSTKIVKFVAACCEMSTEHVCERFSLPAINRTFSLLAFAFVRAVCEFNGLNASQLGGPSDAAGQPPDEGTPSDPQTPEPTTTAAPAAT